MPPADLPVAAQTKAKTLAAALPQSFRDFLQLSGRPWEKLGEEVLSAVRAAGHKIWLCGGATREPPYLLGQHRLPQRALIAYSTKHDGLNPFRYKGIEAIVPAQNHPTADQRTDFFRSK